MRARVVGSMIGLAATVVGCGTAQPAAAPRADLQRVAFSSASEDRMLAAARDRLVRRCMAERGFTYPPTAPSIPAADAPPPGAGYGLFEQFAQPRRGVPRQIGFRRALLGSPRETGTLRLPSGTIVKYRSSGCYPDAMGTLYGSVRRYQWLVARRNELRSAAAVRVERDARLTGVLDGWSRCMALRGFPYPSPDAARMAVYDAYMKHGARVKQRELATAAADRYCAERTRVYAERARAQRDAVRALSSPERALASEIAGMRATALERARRTMSA
jgi:hypothetical protein